jgi:hypothetical protein
MDNSMLEWAKEAVAQCVSNVVRPRRAVHAFKPLPLDRKLVEDTILCGFRRRSILKRSPNGRPKERRSKRRAHAHAPVRTQPLESQVERAQVNPACRRKLLRTARRATHREPSRKQDAAGEAASRFRGHR